MHYICENPHKDRTTRVCVGETDRESKIHYKPNFDVTIYKR